MELLIRMGKNASVAKYELQKLSAARKNQALNRAADSLVRERERILTENKKDIERGEANQMSQGLIDRLRLTDERIRGMAGGLREVALLPDPVGE